MITKNKLIMILSLCVLISLFGYYQTSYAAQAVPAVQAKSDQKAKAVKKVKPAQKATPVQKNTSVQRDWMLTGYGVQLSPDTLGKTLTCNAHYEDSYIAVLSLAKRVHSFKKLPVDFEMEGQIGKHFGEQNHFEVNAVPVVFRWKNFPWDKYVDTGVAVGVGVSYAFEKPDIEENSIGKDHSSPKLLGYLMLEFAFSLPDKPQWSFVTRVHHRSGANGLFDGRLDASNGVGFGIKYSF